MHDDSPETDELRNRLRLLERSLRTRTRTRALQLAAATSAAVLVPALAWTASVPHPDFQPGDPISSSEIDANFAALVEQLGAVEQQIPEPVVISASSGVFVTASAEPVPIPDNEVTLETHGGMVRLELVGSAGEESYVGLIGATGNVGYLGFERSDDGESWTELVPLVFGATSPTEMSVPPGAFSYYDEPDAGTWFYRATIRDWTTVPDAGVAAANVRLVAREIGAAP
jgi:hypothetical protein